MGNEDTLQVHKLPLVQWVDLLIFVHLSWLPVAHLSDTLR